MRKIIASISQNCKLPAICPLCNQYHQHHLALCTTCLSSIIPLGFACSHCANPLPNAHFLLCGACIKTPPYFDNTWVKYRFVEPLRSLIHEFKYQQGLYLTKTLGSLMQESVPHTQDLPDCLIPVPMHASRIKQRGFNQAALLAKYLSKQLAIPCALNLCFKTRNTAPQASLNSEERHKNLLNSFRVTPVPYAHVALVDDLLTTGSTANEIAKLLKKAGVKRVTLWCCART